MTYSPSNDYSATDGTNKSVKISFDKNLPVAAPSFRVPVTVSTTPIHAHYFRLKGERLALWKYFSKLW